jgi:hypothetical protein
MHRIAGAAFAIFVLAPNSVTAQYISFAEWQEMPQQLRDVYTAAVADTLISVGTAEDSYVTNHYRNCLARSRLTNTQLSANVYNFALSRPAIQQTAPSAIVSYLFELCGAPRR